MHLKKESKRDSFHKEERMETIFHRKERATKHTFKEEDEKHPQVEMRGDDEKQDVQPMSW